MTFSSIFFSSLCAEHSNPLLYKRKSSNPYVNKNLSRAATQKQSTTIHQTYLKDGNQKKLNFTKKPFNTYDMMYDGNSLKKTSLTACLGWRRRRSQPHRRPLLTLTVRLHCLYIGLATRRSEKPISLKSPCGHKNIFAKSDTSVRRPFVSMRFGGAVFFFYHKFCALPPHYKYTHKNIIMYTYRKIINGHIRTVTTLYIKFTPHIYLN